MPDDKAAILEARGLQTWYGSVQILHGLDLVLHAGELVAIIGPNGAGKSTALKACFGLIPIRRGTVRYKGRDITGAKPRTLVRQGLAYVPQGRAVFPSLTVSENLDMGGFILKDRAAVRAAKKDVHKLFPLLAERAHQVASSLSGGEQQMLAMGRALMVRPDALLLDEPSVGLAPRLVEEVLDTIQAVNRAGTAIMMVEQNAAMALEIADRAYVLVAGTMRLEGPGRALLDEPEVQRVYLGLPGNDEPPPTGGPTLHPPS